VRALPGEFREYEWAPSTAEIARRAGIAPGQVLRFDGNTPPRPPRTARPDVVARELERIVATPSPALRRSVGKALQRAAPALRQMLPAGLYERMLMQTYDIHRP